MQQVQLHSRWLAWSSNTMRPGSKIGIGMNRSLVFLWEPGKPLVVAAVEVVVDRKATEVDGLFLRKEEWGSKEISILVL